MMNNFIRAVISLILCFLIIAFSMVNSQAQENKQELDLLFEDMLSKAINPIIQQSYRESVILVLMNLESSFSNDKKLTDLLKEIKFEVLSNFSGPFSASAKKVRYSGNRSIEVDLSFIGSTKTIACVAVCESLLPKSFDIFLKIWKQVAANILIEEIQSGVPIRTMPLFSYWNLQLDKMLCKFIEQFTEKASWDILTWAILHEMGHHYLGHLDSSGITDKVSRERELAADLWGFKKMRSLGYSLEMIYRFLVIQAELEEKIYGSVAESGSHPSWRRRANYLLEHFDPFEKSTKPLKILQCIFESKNQRTGGLYTTDAIIIFPKNPIEYGSVLGGICVGNEMQFLTTKIENNEINLYGRPINGKSSRIIIKDISSISKTIEVQDTDSKYSKPYCNGLAFENPLEHYYGIEPFRIIMNYTDQSPKGVIMQELKSLRVGQEMLIKAEHALNKYYLTQSDLLHAYMKGNLSSSALEAEFKTTSNNFKSNFKRILGSETYYKFEYLYFSRKDIQFVTSMMISIIRNSNRSTIDTPDVFKRLRGYRNDLKPASQQFKNVNLRSIGLQDLWSNREIMKKYEMVEGGFVNDFETRTINEKKIIVDNTCNLMWQQNGSIEEIEYSGIQSWINLLNTNRFAGFTNWRLPTLEEAFTLVEPEYYSNEMYIQPVFCNDQKEIWTSDLHLGHREYYSIYTVDFQNGISRSSRKPDEKYFIRAVRSLR